MGMGTEWRVSYQEGSGGHFCLTATSSLCTLRGRLIVDEGEQARNVLIFLLQMGAGSGLKAFGQYM